MLWSNNSYSKYEVYDFADNYKPITVTGVIQEGLKENHDQNIRNYQKAILELQWKNTWSEFWLPEIKLGLSVDSHRFTRLRNATDLRGITGTTPDGSSSIDFGEYTIFNWGKDYLQYLNEKQTYVRDKQVLSESKRELKQELIKAYLTLITKKEIEVSKKLQRRHAGFIYRLNKAKIKASKVSRQEYYQSRAEYLRAYQEFYDARNDLYTAHERLAFMLDDPAGTRYILREKIEYKKIKVSLTDAYEMAIKNNPKILNAKLNYDKSFRNYEIARRENLPLPKFTLNIGAYEQKWGRSFSSQSFGTANGSSNIEIVASLNATWTLMGDKGFMNLRYLKEKFFSRGQASRGLHKYKDYSRSIIRNIYDKIMILQKQMKVVETRLETTKRNYTLTLDHYTKRKTIFVNFLHALREHNESEIALLNTKYNHAIQKLLLAQYSGVENFPGERFEDIVVKGKTIENKLGRESIDPREQNKLKKKEDDDKEGDEKEDDDKEDVDKEDDDKEDDDKEDDDKEDDE